MSATATTERLLEWDDPIGPEKIDQDETVDPQPLAPDEVNRRLKIQAAASPLAEIAAQGDTPETLVAEAQADELPRATALLDEFAERRFDPANPPPTLAPVVTLRGIPVATVGNICLLSGQAGSAKSHSLAAMI